MKIAIAFFGLPRTYKYTSKFIKVKKYFDIDFYGHTWAENIEEKFFLEKDLKNTYKGKFNASVYKYHFNRIGNLLKVNNIIKNNIKDIKNLNQWRSFELSIRQIDKNKKYDLVICTRYDVISEVLFDKNKLLYFVNLLAKKKGIINNSFTNLGETYYPMLDDFIFIGDKKSILKFGKGFTKKNIHRLFLNNNLIDIKNPIEKIIFERLNTDQNQFRVVWFEKTIQNNINLYHEKNKTLIYRNGCPIVATDQIPTDKEMLEIYNYYVEYNKNS